MKYTNKYNLPEPYVRAVTGDDYNRGEDTDYTVTELIKPPRQVQLERLHYDEIVVDVSELVYRLFGKAMHNVLERAGVPERRFTMQILGKTISGKPDRFTKSGLLQDWKLTSMYRFKKGLTPFEVEAQLNCYAELLRQNGFASPKQLEAVPAFRDWSRRKALRDPELPQTAMIVAPAKHWEPTFTRKFLEERVRLHEAAKVRLPDCTPPERWSTGDKVAVMKKGAKKALKLFDTEAQAREFAIAREDRGLLRLEARRGENPRCESYCDAAAFCGQFEALRAAAAQKCDTCGKEKVPGMHGKPYCRYCWRAKKDEARRPNRAQASVGVQESLADFVTRFGPLQGLTLGEAPFADVEKFRAQLQGIQWKNLSPQAQEWLRMADRFVGQRDYRKEIFEGDEVPF